jgi:hypothetical protein
MNPHISLNFMPAFYRRHAGLRYGEAYLFDPAYRAEVQCAEERFLFEALGRHGVGSPRPAPSPSLFIQPVDLIMRTQGAEWRYPEDGTLESWGTPWKDLTCEEIVRLDTTAAAQHPVIDVLLDQYRVLERLYGEQADLCGLKSGMLNIHTPYTTAHQLRGETLFVELLTDPAAATAIMNKVWAIYQAVFGRLAAAIGARPARLQLGDCSASLLSAETYASVVLPVNCAIGAGFASVGYHSCGPSSHLLEAFARLPPLDHIELGPGTDLAAAARTLPGVPLSPLIDPVLMRERAPAAVRAHIEQTLAQTAPAPATTLCVWSLDRDTPIENVAAVYETVEDTRHPTPDTQRPTPNT